MAQMTRNDQGQERPDLAAAALDRGREQLESAKGQLADGAERVADAVERTAEELDGDGQGAISGFGRSVASLTRQLAGGLRERDVEEFARELSTLARRNPGVFLAGSVALGFGIARFFKARTPSNTSSAGWENSGSSAGWDNSTSGSGWEDSTSSAGWQGQSRGVPSGEWHDGDQQFVGTQPEFDAEDGLDLSASSDWQNKDRGTDLPQSAASSDDTNSQGDSDSPSTTGPDVTRGGKL